MKKSILAFCKYYWPEGGGAEYATYLILEEILSKYFNVNIITGTFNPVMIYNQYIYMPHLKEKLKPLEWFKTTLFNNILEKYISSTDIVYIPSHTLFSLIPLIRKKNRKCKIIVHLHNFQPISYSAVIFKNDYAGILRDVKRSLYFEIFEHKSVRNALAASLISPLNIIIHKEWLKDADTIICVSKRQAKLIKKYIPGQENKIKILYNPLPRIDSADKKFNKHSNFLYLGGDSYVKGFPILLKAFNLILRKYPDIKVLLSGSFKNKSYIKMNKRYGTHYQILGHVKHSTVLKLFSVSHAFIFPSIIEEPFPYSVIEAMVSKTIPIASKIGGIPEIIKNTLAEKYLFTPGEVDELVYKVEDILTLSKEQLMDAGMKVRSEIIKKYDRDLTEKKILTLFSN